MSVSSIPESLDMTQDAATLLRLGTAEAHEEAEQSVGAKLLTSGGLSRESYIHFLVVLWLVYSTLEEALDAHSSDPIVSPTYNPRLLSRTSALSADIAYFLQTPETEWKDHPLISSFYRNPPSEVTDYVTSIQSAASSDRSRLLAHAYVRYLGDLSGGQVIKRRIRKAYGLVEEGLSGTQFYDFEKLEGREQANIGDMRTIKVWYRDGLNTGIGDDPVQKAILVEEANVAFRLNEGILSLLQKAEAENRASPDKTRHIPKSNQKSVGVAQVFSLVLLAAGLHVVLQLGGFGNHTSHFSQWTRIQKWISDIFG